MITLTTALEPLKFKLGKRWHAAGDGKQPACNDLAGMKKVNPEGRVGTCARSYRVLGRVIIPMLLKIAEAC